MDTESAEKRLFFACFTEPAGEESAELIQRHFDEHKAWLKARESVIFIAGPLLSESLAPSGRGLIVFRATSLDDAIELAAEDPMHASGARVFRVVPWRLNEGTITAQLSPSTYSFGLS